MAEISANKRIAKNRKVSNEKVLAKNTFMLYLMQISSYIFPLLSFPYLTRVLGPEKYGLVIFANSIMLYFNLFIDFGFLLSGTSRCSLADDDKKKLGNITFGIIQAKIFLVLISSVILFICCFFIKQVNRNLLYFVFSFLGISLTIFLPDYLFRGIEKMSIITYRVLASKAIYTLLIFVLIKNDSHYIFIPIATIGSNIVAIILTWIEIFKKKIISFTRVSVRESLIYLKESSTFFLSRFASTFYTTLNTVLLGINFSNAALGQYGAANTITNTCRSMMSPIADSIYPYMIKQKNYNLVKRILLVLEPIIILGSVLLWFVADPVIRIVCGTGYEGVTPILRAMLPLIIITLPTYLFGFPVLGALDKVKYANISVIFGALFHVSFIILLYFFGYLNFISLSILSFFTECVVFGIRFYVVIKTIKENKQ